MLRRLVVSIASLGLVSVASVGTSVAHMLPARDEIAHFVNDGTCLSIQNESRSPKAAASSSGYPLGFARRARLRVYISCTDAGPGTYYMAFASHRVMSNALRRYPSVQRLGLCVLDHEMLDDDTLDPLPLGRICHRLHGRLLPLTPGKYGHQAPPMTDESTCADYLRATRLDRADYVARQRLFSERRNTRDQRVISTAGKIATVCARTQRRGRASTTRVYLALAEVLGVTPR